jgi:hypothetical protein
MSTPDGVSHPDLTALRTVRIRVTRTRVIETRPADPAAARPTARPSGFARSRFLAAAMDFAGFAVLAAGGYLCVLVV